MFIARERLHCDRYHRASQVYESLELNVLSD
jgi:hypothetical protein